MSDWRHELREVVQDVVRAIVTEKLEEAELKILRHIEKEIKQMSETADQAFSELQAIAQGNADKLTKLQTDVAAALAAIQTGGTLTASQQAAVDQLKATMTSEGATIDSIEATVQPTAPPNP